MQKPIEVKGLWWLPASPTNQIAGILTFNEEEGAFLNLIGTFDKNIISPQEDPDIILGYDSKGKSFTLYNCIRTKFNFPLGGIGSSTYYAHFVFEGVHFKTKKSIKFHELYGSYTDLDAWVDIYGFDIKTSYFNDDYLINIKYEMPTPHLFDIGDSLEAGITFSVDGPIQSIVQKEVAISQRAYFAVKSKDIDRSFKIMHHQLYILASLLPIAAQRMSYPISIYGYSRENQKQYKNGKLHFPEIKIYYQPIEFISIQTEKKPQEFLFTFKDLTPQQIVKWFSLYKKYKIAIDLYRSVFFHKRLFVDTKFLSIAQALELLYSILFKPKINYKDQILELLSRKKDMLEQFIGSDINSFAERVKDTRHEYVHRVKHKHSIKNNEDLIFHIEIMTLTFEIYLLEIIGFSEEKIKELLRPKILTLSIGWQHLRSTKKD